MVAIKKPTRPENRRQGHVAYANERCLQKNIYQEVTLE